MDGTFSALESIKPYGLHEILKSVTTNAPFGSIPTIVTMELAEWDSFDAETQASIRACNLQVEADLARHLDQRDRELQEEFAEQGIAVYALDDTLLDEVRDALAQVSDDYITRMGGRSANIGQAHEALRALRDQAAD